MSRRGAAPAVVSSRKAATFTSSSIMRMSHKHASQREPRRCTAQGPGYLPAMPASNIRALLSSPAPLSDITVQGWVRTRRDSKVCTFIELNDGSCLRGIQVVADANLPCANLYPHILTGASVRVKGDLVQSPGAKQAFEVLAKDIEVLGEADG